MSFFRLLVSAVTLTFTVACSATTPRSPVDAPAPLGSSVVEVPGKRIEVIGLDRWTVSMIEDSLAKYAPGTSLGSHACAAVLRYELGFADAAALSVRMVDADHEQVIVSVVEPQDSARVRLRAVARDTAGVRAEWEPLIRILRDDPVAFQSAIQFYLKRPPPRIELVRGNGDEMAAVWSFLESRASREDAAVAMSTLTAPDPNLYNRMAAAAILLNFPESDSTWWALVETMRESDGAAKGTAGIVLGHLASHAARPVDWAPVAGTLHAMLDGTSLFQLRTLIETLNATGAGPSLAPRVLAGGGRMLVAYAGAESELVRPPAVDLLRRLSGEDLGSDRDAWATWIRGLE